MSHFDSKVVSFDRNASYLYERAMKNKRAGREADALELMRRAVDSDPDNLDYKLELAGIYAQMGLYEQTGRITQEILINGEKKQECLYPMALGLFHRGEISRAERVLRAYTDMNKPGERHSDAKRLLDEIVIARDIGRPDRKTLRAMRAVNRACAMMNAGDYKEGEKYFRKAVSLNDTAPEVHSLLALTLHLKGDDEKALSEIEKAIELSEKSPESRIRTYSIASQALRGMGKDEEAEELLRKTLPLSANQNDIRLRLNALAEIGMHREVHEESARLLKESPYDKQLLHMLSMSAFMLDEDEEEITSGWQRILRLDPDDPASRYYLEKYSENKDEIKLSYVYALPEREVMARIMLITEMLMKGQEALRQAWETNERFRSIIEWEMLQRDSKATRIALAALLGVNTEETRRMVRVYSERPDVSLNLRMYLIQGMYLMNYPAECALGDSFVYAGMPGEEEAMETLSVAEKQMIRFAAEYVEDKYGDYPVADIALIWRAFMEKRRGSLGDPVRRADGGSAALAMCYLDARMYEDDIVTISRWYGCSARQAAYIAKLIRNSINSIDETKL